jgi:REP element-mobilizing transposase RayT
MPLPERRWLYHTPPAWAKDATYFITLCCQQRNLDQLTKPEVASELLRSLRSYHEQNIWYISLCLLMPDHLHALISCSRDEVLSKRVASWKRFTARELGIQWQKGFFDHRLRGDESLEEKAHYIRMNPVRKGLVARPEDWPHQWEPAR